MLVVAATGGCSGARFSGIFAAPLKSGEFIVFEFKKEKLKGGAAGAADPVFMSISLGFGEGNVGVACPQPARRPAIGFGRGMFFGCRGCT